MQNILKIALIILGFRLTISGFGLLFLPEGFWVENTVVFANSDTQNQSIALIVFGVLVLLAGLGFRKR